MAGIRKSHIFCRKKKTRQKTFRPWEEIGSLLKTTHETQNITKTLNSNNEIFNFLAIIKAMFNNLLVTYTA